MKKLSIAIMLSLASTVLFAQDVELESTDADMGSGGGKGFGPLKSTQELSTTSKNGQEILPQAGDWGLGIGASNTLGYFGDLMNGGAGNDGNDPYDFTDNFTSDQVIYGKYFLASDLAYRGYVRLNYNRTVAKAEVGADLNDNPDAYVTDTRTITTSGVTIGAGLEKRRGSGRLIGVYGAQAFFSFDQGQSRSMDYGNDYSLGNQNPTASGLTITNTAAPNPAFGDRIIKSSNGSSYGLGVAAFIGAEYYFAPKMSVGGEFYWGIQYNKGAVASETWEAWEPSTGEVVEYVSNSVGGSSIDLGLDNVGGAINLFLYF